MVEKTTEDPRARSAPNSLISFVSFIKRSTTPVSLPLRGDIVGSETALLRWDTGETYIWDRAARKAYLPQIQAQREQCCYFYLEQIDAAFNGKVVDMETFLWSLRGVLTVKLSRFAANPALQQRLSQMQQFLETDDIGLYQGLVTGIWDFWQDDDARKQFSTIHMRAYACRLEMDVAQMAVARMWREKADKIDYQARSVYAALLAWDNATSFLTRIIAWGALVVRSGFIFPWSAREFYQTYHLSNVAETLKATKVKAMLTESKGLQVIGDSVVKRFFKPKQEKQEKIEPARPPIDVRQQEKDFLACYNKNESSFQKLAKQCHATLRILHEDNQEQPIESINKIKLVLDMYVALAKTLDEIAELFDPQGTRKEKRLVPWCAKLAPSSAKHSLAALGTKIAEVEKKLGALFAGSVDKTISDDAACVAQVKILLTEAKASLPRFLGSGETVLFAEFESKVSAKENELYATCCQQLALIYQEAKGFIGSAEFRRMTVSDVLQWRRSLEDNMTALVDRAQLEGSAQIEVRVSIRERGQALDEQMDAWYSTYIAEWRRDHQPALELHLTTLEKKLSSDSPFIDAQALLAESVIFLSILQHEAHTHFDQQGARGEKRIFAWQAENSGSRFKELFQALDNRVVGIERQLEKRFEQLLAPMEGELAKLYETEVLLLNNVYAPAGVIVGWQEGCVARYCDGAAALLEPMQAMLAKEKEKLQGPQKVMLFEAYEAAVVRAHLGFKAVLQHKAQKWRDNILDEAKKAEEAGWASLRELVKEGREKAMPAEADRVAKTFGEVISGLRIGLKVDDRVALESRRDRLTSASEWVGQWLAERRNIGLWKEDERRKAYKQLAFKYHPDKQKQEDEGRVALTKAIFQDMKRSIAQYEETHVPAIAFEDIDKSSLQSCQRYVNILQARYLRQYELLCDKMMQEAKDAVPLTALKREYLLLEAEIAALNGANERAIVLWEGNEPLPEENEKELWELFIASIAQVREIALSEDDKKKLEETLGDATFVVGEAYKGAVKSRRTQKKCEDVIREGYADDNPALQRGVRVLEETLELIQKRKEEEQKWKEAEEKCAEKDEVIQAKDAALVIAQEALKAVQEARKAEQEAVKALEERVKQAEALLARKQSLATAPQSVETMLQFQGYQPGSHSSNNIVASASNSETSITHILK